MKNTFLFGLILILCTILAGGFFYTKYTKEVVVVGSQNVEDALEGRDPKTLSDAEWKQILPPEAYAVLREEGTEIPFTSTLLNEHRKGTFVTADCGVPVFRSEDKYDSGTGWPSFTKPISEDAVVYLEDKALGISRTEVRDAVCESHLGHVFDDGPEPTGKRYCMNGVALRFIPDEK